MFYTLVSRTIITKINTPRDYLYIFLIGSVAYVIIHWYLHMEKREGIVEKAREYLYYLMVFDAIVAYALMMLYPTKDAEKDNDVDESNDKENKDEPYTADQKKVIMQKMQEARRLEQLRQKHLAETQVQAQTQAQTQTQTQEQNVGKSAIPDKPQNKESDDVPGKKSIFTKSEDSKESHETEEDDEEDEDEPKPDIKVKGKEKEKEREKPNEKIKERVKEKKKESEIEDTEIQVFEANDKSKDKKKAHKE